MNKAKLLISIACIIVLQYKIKACSAFSFKVNNSVYIAKSYDWFNGQGYILVNKRGETKFSFPVDKNTKSFSWTSKYGSVTFNQYSKDFPNGGINEKGLVIEVLWLNKTNFGKIKNNKVLNELQWIQYGLDNFKNVNELLNNIKAISIKRLYAKVHFFIGDASGKSAIVEYIKGKLVVNTKPQNMCITNNTYKISESFKVKLKNKGTRYLKIKSTLKNIPESLSSNKACNMCFSILKNVKLRNTKWHIVYDIKSNKILYKSNTHKNIKTINLNTIQYNQNKKIDINKKYSLFSDFTYVDNFFLIKKGLYSLSIFIKDEYLTAFNNFILKYTRTNNLHQFLVKNEKL